MAHHGPLGLERVARPDVELHLEGGDVHRAHSPPTLAGAGRFFPRLAGTVTAGAHVTSLDPRVWILVFGSSCSDPRVRIRVVTSFDAWGGRHSVAATGGDPTPRA